jgi:hypothetical protein
MKTSELQGAALDWAVARCEGYTYEIDRDECWLNHRGRPFTNLTDYCPSDDWELGGPIIERERICISTDAFQTWMAWRYDGLEMTGIEHGPTPLVAAMRCYVASKMDDEVELPEELK